MPQYAANTKVATSKYRLADGRDGQLTPDGIELRCEQLGEMLARHLEARFGEREATP